MLQIHFCWYKYLSTQRVHSCAKTTIIGLITTTNLLASAIWLNAGVWSIMVDHPQRNTKTCIMSSRVWLIIPQNMLSEHESNSFRVFFQRQCLIANVIWIRYRDISLVIGFLNGKYIFIIITPVTDIRINRIICKLPILDISIIGEVVCGRIRMKSQVRITLPLKSFRYRHM